MDGGIGELVVSAIVGSGTGGTIVGIMAKFALDRAAKRWDAMEAEIKRLRDDKIAGIEGRVSRVEVRQAECPIAKMDERMDNLLGWTKKIDLKLDRLVEMEAKDQMAVEAAREYVRNLDAAHQRLSEQFHDHATKAGYHG